MNLTTIAYILFLCFAAFLFRVVPVRYRAHVLTITGLAFAMTFDVVLVALLVAFVGVNFLFLRAIRAASGNTGRILLWVAIATDIALLGIFKYGNFVRETVAAFGNASARVGFQPWDLVAVAGISFFTFRALSSLIDASRENTSGKQAPVGSFAEYAAYITFFPQLLSGPIQRWSDFREQLHAANPLTRADGYAALERIALGLVKKTVVAERIAQYVNPVFADVSAHGGAPLMIAVYLYALQIYFDFSGYTDIAIGSARLFGIVSPENFDRPYTAANIREFWRRWHITLSQWFRDYLYIPLGGNRVAVWRRDLNVLIVFLATGLWHGAAWTFVVWGLIHGVYQLVAGRIETAGWFARFRQHTTVRVRFVIGTALTFHLIVFSWVFFRAETLYDAGYILTNLFGTARSETALTVPVILASMIGVAWIGYELATRVSFRFKGRAARIVLGVAFTVAFLLLGVFEAQDFLYFKF
jgi:D-alanyl-lipoteichoic acid acyltransferase DltB (MBOAT superfamily)